VLSTIPIPDEGALMERLRRQDPTALSVLFDSYGVVVYRLALRIVREHGASEDIVQETFARVWNNAHMINEGAGRIGPWIMTIARHLALDLLRHSGTRATHREPLLDQIPVASTTEQSLISEENARLIARALKTLNPQQKRVIELAYFSGMSQTQMAQELNEPLGTIKSWTRAALVHLRAVLQSNMKDIEHA
jgi:RNA polymerase sigma-70 factor (ECF subfamily)